MDGANFTSGGGTGGGKKKKPRRPSKDFIIDERPPPMISLNWLSIRGFLRFSVYALGTYMVVDSARYLIYRFSPATVPLQPSSDSTIVSTSFPHFIPCGRFPSSRFILTEASVRNDSAPYLPGSGSASTSSLPSAGGLIGTAGTSAATDSGDAASSSDGSFALMPHHRPRRDASDRMREVHDFFGFVAEKIANSIVVYSGGASPGEAARVIPPKEVSDRPSTLLSRVRQQLQQQGGGQYSTTPGEKEGEDKKLDPFAFDAPPSSWPTRQEQKSTADLLTEKQSKRLEETHEDIWGKKVIPGISKDANKNVSRGFAGIVSWTTSRSDVRKSPDFGPLPEDDIISADDAARLDKDMPNYKTLEQIKEEQLNRPKDDLREVVNDTVKSAEELPHRYGSDHHDEQLQRIVAEQKEKEKKWNIQREEKRQQVLLQRRKQEQGEGGEGESNNNNNTRQDGNSTASGSTLRDDTPNMIDATLNRFMTLQLEDNSVSNPHYPSSSSSSSSYQEQQDQQSKNNIEPIISNELRVKCIDASAAGGTRSRCPVDSTVLCAPRHRAMLAAFALLPDPLPTHLQIATFGVGPTSIAAFIFKFFAAHLKRLDVVAEPSLFEHPGIIDFGLTSRAGPVQILPSDEEKFLLRTDKKYDLLFISPSDSVSGRRCTSNNPYFYYLNHAPEKCTNPLSPSFVSLVKTSLSKIGVAAFELGSDDFVSAKIISDVFGSHNCFFIPVPKSNNRDLVVLAGYALPKEGVWKRHITERAEDISYDFRLPYDIGAHLPLSWKVW